MSDINTKTVAKAFICENNPNCVTQAEKYINEEPEKIFDSYTCQATPLMSGGGGRSEYLHGLLVLCTGKPRVFIKKQ